MAAKTAKIPLWLFEDSYHIVGDLAETISHLVCQKERNPHNGLKLHELISQMIENRGKKMKKSNWPLFHLNGNLWISILVLFLIN